MSAPRTSALLAFPLIPAAVFSMGYGAHVRQWRRHMRAETWTRYWSDPAFAALYDAGVLAQANAPMPPLRSCA